MTVRRSVYIILLLGWQGTQVEAEPKSGPYTLVVSKLEPCKDEGTGQVHFPPTISKLTRDKLVYNGSITVGVPVDEDFIGTVELQQMGANGGYRPRAINVKVKGCEKIWRYIKETAQSIMKSAGVDLKGCPLPAGNYTIHNWVMDVDLRTHIPVMLYGKYRVVIQVFQKKVKLGCLVAYEDVVPRDTR